MAANFIRPFCSQPSRLLEIAKNVSKSGNSALSIRQITTRDTGSVFQRPEQVRFGLIKVVLVVTPFLLGGATISREFAAWLEEHELFVPDDDDD